MIRVQHGGSGEPAARRSGSNMGTNQSSAPVPLTEGAFSEFLIIEQIRNARLLNLLRGFIAGAFLIIHSLSIGFGLGPGTPLFSLLLAGYAAASAGIHFAGRKSDPVARRSRHAVPFLDLPLAFLLQWINLNHTDDPRAVASFTVAVFLTLVMFASLSLDRWQIRLAATMAVVLQTILYRYAGSTLPGTLGAGVLTLTVALVCEFARQRRIEMVQGICTEQLRRERLGRYFSPAVAVEIQREGDGLNEARYTEVTVLFADLRDFTTLAEHLETREVVALLNEYFECMVQVIFAHGGTLDKYIGDGLMAYFGAPVTQENHARRGVECAIAMQKRLTDFNADRLAKNLPTLRMGIGLHSGDAVVGSIGASHRREYTAVGDTVNVAARIEQLCKKFDRDLLVSSDTARLSHEAARYISLGETLLKGRQATIEVLGIAGGVS